MLLQLLGIVMKKVTNKQFVNGALEKIFEHVNHSHPQEREASTQTILYLCLLVCWHAQVEPPC